MSEAAESRTPAQIEADIVRRRQDLAAALDEIAVRVHPRTIAADTKAKAAAAVDRTAGRAYVAVNRAVTQARGHFTSEDGSPRMERILPVAIGVLVVAVTVGGLSYRRRRR